jgi:hypothetical protein
VVDKLADEYMGQPVVFLEYNVNGSFYSRSSRWWQASGQDYASLPMVMVDSGNQYTSGYVNFEPVFKAMVDTSILRPPQAALEAYAWRDGNKVDFYAQVQNLSGVTLSPTNNATVHGIVYEDIHAGATDRYVLASVSTSIPNLPANEIATFRIETFDLEGVNWDKLHYIVMVDYTPLEPTGAYDMLQAVHASLIPAPFTVDPISISFCVEPQNLYDPTMTLNLTGADFLEWSALADVAWLTIAPDSGTVFSQPVITAFISQLPAGVSQGTITFTTDDGYFSKVLNFKVFYGVCEQSYIPIVNH